MLFVLFHAPQANTTAAGDLSDSARTRLSLRCVLGVGGGGGGACLCASLSLYHLVVFN